MDTFSLACLRFSLKAKWKKTDLTFWKLVLQTTDFCAITWLLCYIPVCSESCFFYYLFSLISLHFLFRWFQTWLQGPLCHGKLILIWPGRFQLIRWSSSDSLHRHGVSYSSGRAGRCALLLKGVMGYLLALYVELCLRGMEVQVDFRSRVTSLTVTIHVTPPLWHHIIN